MEEQHNPAIPQSAKREDAIEFESFVGSCFILPGWKHIPYFSVYKTILLSKIFRLKIEGCLIHGSKLRREQNKCFDPFPPTLAKRHLDFLILG